MKIFCFGIGYSAETLAPLLRAQGWAVTGTKRRAQGEFFAFDGSSPMADAQGALSGTTHVLLSIPPDGRGDPAFFWHARDLEALAPSLRWVGYLSTTGVYGDAQGGWVDEECPVQPQSERGRRRALAESQWLAFGAKTGVSVQVFRLAGIYGPGRSAIDSLQAGTARRIVKPGQVFSRIHVDDIAAVLLASIARPRAGAIYNVCDDEAAPPHEVIAYAAALIGMTPPPLEDFETAQASMSEMARSFYAETKRVRNERIKQELGVRLRYPSFREGLKALAGG